MTKGLQLPRDNEPDTLYPYRSLIGILLWFARTMYFDVMFPTVYLASFNHCYTSEHFKAAKRVLKYVYHHQRDLV